MVVARSTAVKPGSEIASALHAVQRGSTARMIRTSEAQVGRAKREGRGSHHP